MPYREDEFAPDQYYHIFNRGAGREANILQPRQLLPLLAPDEEVCSEV